jgi:exonuclease SbcD
MKLAITADWHCDQYGSRLDPETGINARLLDYLRTATWVAEEAKRCGAEALLVLGDFSERRHINGWLIARIMDALAAGPERVIALAGNHDGSIGGRSIVDIINRRQGWDGVGERRVIRIGDVAICAIGFLDRHWLRTQPGYETVPDADIYRTLAELYLTIARGMFVEAMEGGARTAILVGHQGVSGGRMSESQQAFLGDVALVVDSAALASIGYSMVALGHFHLAQTCVDKAECPVVYAGSIERVDFGEEAQEKSFLMVDVDEAGVATYERVETPARRFVTLTEEDLHWDDIDDRVRGAIVRVLDVPVGADVADLRRNLEGLGAFEVAEIRVRPAEAAAPSPGGFGEAVSPTDALVAYFEGDPDAEALVERGRVVLAEVAA